MPGNETTTTRTGLEIAVIGMSGCFPGARSIDEFWDNSQQGKESIAFFSDAELQQAGVETDLLHNPNYVRAAGIVTGSDYFDALFFDYTPAEAAQMDPQIRVFHEHAWKALEDAGYAPGSCPKKIGIYAGASQNFGWEALTQLSGDFNWASAQLAGKDYLATRVAHKLNLRGPAVFIQTACSTSLAALHIACQGLLCGDCDMALAGGVSLYFSKAAGYLHRQGMIFSSDGHCRAFDARADGTVAGNGVGVVLLKPLEEAILDRDYIHAVIKGSAVNNDGIDKAGYTAPGVAGQVEAIRTAIKAAGVESETIGCIEAHGTGTILGDPIEIEALKLAFNTPKTGFCAISSVKSNIGHLDAAAGIVGFIKTIQALKHRLIPPGINFETTNPRIDFANSPFYVAAGLREWQAQEYPRRAAVSSLGIGGTNAHVILEEWPDDRFAHSPDRQGEQCARPYRLILLSARDADVLEAMAKNLAGYFRENPGIALGDAAYTLQQGRRAFNQRLKLVCSNIEEAAAVLSDPFADQAQSFCLEADEAGDRLVVFMFPGQGSQYEEMGLGLYSREPRFRQEMDSCFEILNPLLDFDLKTILYPVLNKSFAGVKGGLLQKPPLVAEGKPDIDRTEVAQPLLFAIEYALARLLMSWGIKPAAMIGHSIGEYTAACLAGVFSLPDALKIIVLRARLMQRLTQGAMLSVMLSQEELEPLLAAHRDVSLAAVNGLRRCVVSGSHEAIEAFSQELAEKSYEAKRLHTSHAFHSGMMEPMLEEFAAGMAGVKLQQPQIPYISNITGSWISGSQAVDPGYWAQHLRKTVRFGDGLSELMKEERYIFVEVGPAGVLSGYVRQHPAKQSRHEVFALMRHPHDQEDDFKYLLEGLGELWLHGCGIDWAGFYREEERYRVPLPTYPFVGQRYPISGSLADIAFSKKSGGDSRGKALKKKAGVENWLYIPGWKHEPLYVPEPVQDSFPEVSAMVNCRPLLKTKQLRQDGSTCWLFLMDDDREKEWIGNLLVERLRADNLDVRIIGRSDEIPALLDELLRQGKTPARIVHLLLLGFPQDAQAKAGTEQGLAEFLERGFYSLLRLTQALADKNITRRIFLAVLTDRLQQVGGEEVLIPQKAVVLGPMRVIPKEYPNIRCCCLDIQVPTRGSLQEERLVQQLAAELQSDMPHTLAAYRHLKRFVQVFEPLQSQPHSPPDAIPHLLRQGGVYLVTGGLGGIGLTLAKYLARSVQAKLILTGRTALPARKQWQQWLKSHSHLDKTSRSILAIKQLEDRGAQVLVYAADAADLQAMETLVRQAEEKFGAVNGVIHCAGFPGKGVIQLKTPGAAREVLAPKVLGVLALDQVFRQRTLDFMLLCSSISAVMPAIGQVDYCAANAVLDAYALYKNLSGHYTISVAWDAWQELGMAAEAAGLAVYPVYHPLLQRCSTGSIRKETAAAQARRIVYSSDFRFADLWTLHEHKTPANIGIMPGATYLEMARAAIELYLGKKKNQAVAIGDILFSTPLTVAEQEEKEVRLVLQEQIQPGSGEPAFTFRVMSASTAADASGKEKWQIHAHGRIGLEKSKPAQHDIARIKASCSEKHIAVGAEPKKQSELGLLLFGPRWRTLRHIYLGQDQGLAELELDETFTSDLDDYPLHPALLDSAAGFLAAQIDKDNPYIPLSYKRVVIKGPMTGKIYSYARPAAPAAADTLSFHVTIMDEQGRELVEIEEFTLLKIGTEIMERINRTDPGFTRHHAQAEAPAVDDEIEAAPADLLEHGILPDEGVAVFKYLLAQPLPQLAQALVSTTDLHIRFERYNKIDAASLLEQAQTDKIAERPAPYPAAMRPNLKSKYEAPNSAAEKIVAGIWQEVLGFNQVGVADNFFELGGDSLSALRVSGKVQRELGGEIPLAEFFKRPTIKELAGFIQENKKEKKPGPAAISMFQALAMTENKEYYPLSSTQRRFYILWHTNPDNTAYNLPEIVLLEGNLDKARLEKAFSSMLARHENFRVSFQILNGKPIQRICDFDRMQFALEYFDAKSSPDAGGSPRPETSIIERFIRPFDLSRPPLMRAGAIRLEANKHLLLLDTHHIVYDGVSMPLFFRDFKVMYGGADLPGLKIRCRDFLAWEDSANRRQEATALREHWLSRFAGEIPVLELPTDFPRPQVRSYDEKRLSFAIGETETAGLKELAELEGATIYMMILALFNILLAKLADSHDIVIGAPAATRKHPDLQDIIGLFLNTLALRNEPAGEKDFRAFLREVKERTLNDFDNQDYPLEDLVNDLGLKRAANRNPLFDVILILHNELQAAKLSLDLDPGLKLKGYDYTHTGSIFDLALNGVELKGALYFDIGYSTQLFREETVRRFIACFQEIVNEVLQEPDKKIADIDISVEFENREGYRLPELSDREIETLLYRFNDNKLDYPRELLVHQAIAARADQTPDRIALVYEHHYLSYRQLNSRAAETARLLIAEGLRREQPVGILLQRSFLMAASILAVWLAGGAYIPLDPDSPVERLSGILNDAGAVLSISSREDVPVRLEQIYPGRIVILARQADDDLLHTLAPATHAAVNPQTLAYVIYTSGSTGKPKGAMIEHAGMMNHIQAKIHDLQIGGQSTVAQNAAHTFDISVWQFFASLVAAGRTVIYPRALVQDVERLLLRLEADQVSILEVVPSYLSAMLDTLAARSSTRFLDSPASQPTASSGAAPGAVHLYLEYLLTTGEPVKPAAVRRWFEFFSGVKMVNAYGPTEASDDITHHIMEMAPEERVSIGKPLHNLAIFILDSKQQLLPIGDMGEIYVGGVGVGRGYLNDPNRTMEAFCEVGLPGRKPQRLYRTGDLGRWSADGAIEFFGRQDTQVKIRGFRIELGEIENRLLEYEGIAETAVIDRENEKGEKYLCAYLVPKAAAAAPMGERKALDIAKVKEFLMARLPQYMIPGYFVLLQRLPLTANGKLDRKALPAPQEHQRRALPFISAARLLELEHKYQDKSSAAAALDIAALTRKEIAVLKEYSAKQGREFYPLSHPQKVVYYIEKTYPGTGCENDGDVVTYREILDREVLRKALCSLVRRNENLHTRIVEVTHGDFIGPAQYIAAAEDFALDYFDFSGEGGRERLAKWVQETTDQPFDFIDGRLFYFAYLQLGEEVSGYYMKLHHIISDGGSTSLAIQEIDALYRGLVDGKSPAAEAKPSHLRFVRDEKEYLCSAAAAQDRERWLQYLQPLPAKADISSAKGNPLNIRGASCKIVFDGELRRRMHEYCRENRTSLYKLILAALTVYVSRATCLDEFVIGTVNHGRSFGDYKEMLGMFINFIPFKVRVDNGMAFREFVHRLGADLNEVLKGPAKYPNDLLSSEMRRLTGEDTRYFWNITLIGHPDKEMSGYEMEHFSSAYEATPLDIHINCSNRDVRGELELEWVYRLEYFSEAMIRQIHYYLSNILANALDDPGRRVGEIELLARPAALSAGPRAEALDKSFAGVKGPAARAAAKPHQNAAASPETALDKSFAGVKGGLLQKPPLVAEGAEIETYLMKYAGVSRAVLTTRRGGSGNKYLCACLVFEEQVAQGNIPDEAALREYLAQAFPVKLPVVFVQLEMLPMTPEGEINRKLLAAAAEGISVAGAGQVDVFMSGWEKIIADAWKEVLHLEAVGVEDNFFDIGGTSLNIIQVNIKLKEVLKREIPVLAMYEYPTIAGLAKYLAGETGAGSFPQPAAFENAAPQSKETLLETVEVFAGLEE